MAYFQPIPENRIQKFTVEGDGGGGGGGVTPLQHGCSREAVPWGGVGVPITPSRQHFSHSRLSISPIFSVKITSTVKEFSQKCCIRACNNIDCTKRMIYTVLVLTDRVRCFFAASLIIDDITRHGFNFFFWGGGGGGHVTT